MESQLLYDCNRLFCCLTTSVLYDFAAANMLNNMILLNIVNLSYMFIAGICAYKYNFTLFVTNCSTLKYICQLSFTL